MFNTNLHCIINYKIKKNPPGGRSFLKRIHPTCKFFIKKTPRGGVWIFYGTHESLPQLNRQHIGNCEPSPYIVISSLYKAWFMKFVTTLPSSLSMLGSYVLNIRITFTSTLY